MVALEGHEARHKRHGLAEKKALDVRRRGVGGGSSMGLAGAGFFGNTNRETRDPFPSPILRQLATAQTPGIMASKK